MGYNFSKFREPTQGEGGGLAKLVKSQLFEEEKLITSLFTLSERTVGLTNSTSFVVILEGVWEFLKGDIWCLLGLGWALRS